MILPLKGNKKNIILKIIVFIILCSSFLFPCLTENEKIVLTQEDIITLNRIDILAYPAVFLNVMVTDDRGEPVEGLGVKDFTVFENGIQQEINTVINNTNKSEPIKVMLTIDASGSMGEEQIRGDEDSKAVRPVDDAKEACKNFVSTLKDGDEIIVSGFANYWMPLNEITKEHSIIIGSIDKLEPEGGTVLFQAVSESVNLMKKLDGNKAVIILTDGKDSGINVSLEDCINNIKRQGVPVFTIGLGSDIDETNLVTIAQVTGGRYFKAPNSSKLSEIYELISRQLEKQYWLSYRVKKSHPVGSVVDVTVSSPFPGIKGNSTLSYITPPQVIKRSIEFTIGLVAIILLTFMFFHLFWKGFGFDPVISTYISILISIFLSVGFFTFLFLSVFIYYKISIQVFFTVGLLSILSVIFIIWKIKDYT